MAADRGVSSRYKRHRLTGHPHTAVYITGQRRGVTDKIKRWLKRRAVVEPIIGHAKNDGLLGRNWLKGRTELVLETNGVECLPRGKTPIATRTTRHESEWTRFCSLSLKSGSSEWRDR